MQGIFLDSPVAGLYYETATLDGYTDAEGTFLYREGETVTFYLQNLHLGQAPAVAVLTPIEIVPGAEDETDPTVTNLCLLLQTLDEDGDLDNGIVLSEAIGLAIEGRSINLNQPTTEFIEDPDLIDLLQYLNANGAFTDGGGRELRTPEEAQEHLLSNLADQDRDGDGFSPSQGDCSDDNIAVNPGAAEICCDDIEQDCSGAVLACPGDESDYESSLRDLISNYRQENGLGRLAFDAPLHDLAQEHSTNMQASGVMSHDGFTERYNRSGYGICVENVGWNYPTPEAMFDGWRNSSGHNTNMLDARIDWAGVSREGAYITFFACGN
ncbi:MAG: hypothetical protein K8R55_10835 [Desulfuromonadaceae bacterium]|nr:hypothetical protein [Desulfuromonadaceae bacterium]